MRVLYFVTGNEHKVKEAQNILDKYNIKVKVKPLGVEKVEIQADTLEEIVSFAARWIVKNNSLCDFFLEDAGLFIEEFGGFPGPYSKYVFKKLGNEGILKLMKDVSNRRATFKSSVALCLDNHIKIFSAQVHGIITNSMRGNKGFGFDPIFVPDGHDRTFAEMEVWEKNEISHRGKAIKMMAEYLKKKLDSL